MAYGMAEWHTEWRNGIRNGGMAEWHTEWQNGIRNGIRNCGNGANAKKNRTNGNRAKGYITCVEEGKVTKQNGMKGYEDELQAHFNSII
jgi:hypothetical protein